MHRHILLFLLIVFSVGPVMAQQNARVAANAISSVDTPTGKVYYANVVEPPRAMEFKERTVTVSHLLANINQYFNVPAEYTFIQAESNTDDLGMRHRLLQQYYKGIPVEGMGYRIHERNGFVTSANGRAVRNINLDTQINLNEEQAFRLAVNYLKTTDTTFKSGKKLIVSKGFTFAPESFSLVFQFDIDVSLIEQWRVSIDANNGQLINKVSLVNSCLHEAPQPLPYDTGTGLTNYYGSKTIRVEKNGEGSRLVGLTENGGEIGTYDFQNVSVLSLTIFYQFHKAYDVYSSNNTYNTTYHKPAVSVQWAAEQAYEYYFKKHNRNSFDNNGSLIKSYVHVDKNMNNAFWTHNLMAFGDGSNNNPLVELDVVGHELTHGVTQYEARLEYYNEPGALNESFSDILGKAIEFDTFGDDATWQLAKHNRDGGLRDMSNPNLKDQPDTYAGYKWYTGYEDNGGVHYNSGVQNFWFYLLCEGGSGVNDHQFNYSINAIGMDAATKIAYRNLTEYLSSQSDYLDSRIGSLLATADLYGKTSMIYQEVDKAWDAVGVIDEPIITSLELYDITATTVKIKGGFQPRADTATYHFEYGTTPAFGSSSAVYGYKDKVEGIIRGLQSATKYYLRLVATNENGSSYYTTEFTTLSLAPLVKIKETVDVTETTATMYGKINPNSLPTSFYFEYGLTPALGLVTPSYSLSDTTEFLNVSSAPVTGLQPRKTYYYRLVATNGFASSITGIGKFFTAVRPVITSYSPVAAPVGTEVTITGQNFNSISQNNLISFGATRAIVLSSSSTQVKVKVPQGASLGPISVLDAESGLTAESVAKFVPTFTGEFKKSDLQLTMGSTDYVYQTLVQDMDGDNKPDIVALHYLGFSIFVNVVSQGGDITEESFVRSTFNKDVTPGPLSLVDIDGNGLKDIVEHWQGGLRIYPNYSVPGYVFFGSPVYLQASLESIVFNDFDMDGHIDIAGIDYQSVDNSILTIFRNQNPKGSLTADNFEPKPSMNIPYYVYSLKSDDLNNDGKPDLIVGVYNETFVLVLKNNSHFGAFEFEENKVEDSNQERFPSYLSQDFNLDGLSDIAITALSSSEVGNLSMLQNKGTSLNITMEKPVVALSGYIPNIIQPGDINGDGKVDLMVGINKGKFILLKNNVVPGEHLSGSSFEKFNEYGMVNDYSTHRGITINDLNGDGRPEVINIYSFNRFPHDGYQMEIWQNAPRSCLDPSLVTVTAISNFSLAIGLPPNTTLDQFDIEYSIAGQNSWTKISSKTFSVAWSNYSYQLRARAKCYLGFTEYYYTNFVTECVNTSSFSVSSIGINSVSLQASSLSSFEIQYSPAGKNQWITVPQYNNQIADLSPGTTYDVRFRGRCTKLSEYKYKQFTTLCPKLSTLTIVDIRYNEAVVKWSSVNPGNAILEYSADNVNWTLIGETGVIPALNPSKQYYVRGKMACTNINSDFIYALFRTVCPKVSTVSIDAITPFSARVNWIDESNTGSYTVTYSPAIGSTETTMQISSTSVMLKGLSPGTTYTVNVAPHCISSKQFTSAAFSTVCFVPFSLSINDVTHTTAELSWNDDVGGVPYYVDYTISGSNSWLTSESALRNVSLTKLRPGTLYEARVYINCLSQPAPYASIFFETNVYGETTVAPNPIQDGKVTIYPSKNLIGNNFSILDNTGKTVARGKLLDYTIDLSDFLAGIYVLKIDGEKAVKVFKK